MDSVLQAGIATAGKHHKKVKSFQILHIILKLVLLTLYVAKVLPTLQLVLRQQIHYMFVQAHMLLLLMECMYVHSKEVFADH